MEHVNGADRIQLVFTNYMSNTTMLVTWNLRKNIEDRAMEVQGQGLSITKGINSTLNYIDKDGVAYDLEYGFPLNFFAQSLGNGDVEGNGAYMSEGKDMLLAKNSDSLSVSRTVTELDRRFLE